MRRHTHRQPATLGRKECENLTLAVARWVAQAADHDLSAAQTVRSVRIRQVTLPEQFSGFHHLRTDKFTFSGGVDSTTDSDCILISDWLVPYVVVGL